MHRVKPKDNRGHKSDKSVKGNEVIGGIRLVLPINRNLSQKLFGQLKNVMDRAN